MKFLMCSIPSLGLLSLVLAVHAQECQVNMDWVGVPEYEYDTSYASIADPDGRPLGFNRSAIPYENEGVPNPCIRVSGTADRRVEVMAESIPVGSTICTYRQSGLLECSNAGIYFCEQVYDNEINYEFFCEGNSCDQTNVRFFYRFTVSPPPSEMDPELWCFLRDTGDYPSILSPSLPPDVTMAAHGPTNQFKTTLFFFNEPTPSQKTTRAPILKFPVTSSKGSSHNYTAISVLGIFLAVITTIIISF